MRAIRRARSLTGVLALLGGTAIARAHDPYESWASAILRADELELTVTMAQSTALRVVDPEKAIQALSEENFAAHRAKFAREGRLLFVLTSARKALVARRSEASLSEENDVIFKLIYARPATGPLHLHAAFLRRVGPGYGAIFDASDTVGNHLGWEQLSFENPNFEIAIPAPNAPPRKN